MPREKIASLFYCANNNYYSCSLHELCTLLLLVRLYSHYHDYYCKSDANYLLLKHVARSLWASLLIRLKLSFLCTIRRHLMHIRFVPYNADISVFIVIKLNVKWNEQQRQFSSYSPRLAFHLSTRPLSIDGNDDDDNNCFSCKITTWSWLRSRYLLLRREMTVESGKNDFIVYCVIRHCNKRRENPKICSNAVQIIKCWIITKRRSIDLRK